MSLCTRSLLFVLLLTGCPAQAPQDDRDAASNTAPDSGAPNDDDHVVPNNGTPENANQGLEDVYVELQRVEWGLFADPRPASTSGVGSQRDGYVEVHIDGLPPGAWSVRVMEDSTTFIDTSAGQPDRLVPLSGDITTQPFFNPATTDVTFRVYPDPWRIEARERADVARVGLDSLDVATAVGPWFETAFQAVIDSNDPGGAVVELMHEMRAHGGPLVTDEGVLFIAPAQDGEAAPQVRGTWNDFGPDPASELRRISPGFWARFVDVPAGRHEYKIYYPSGDAWVTDVSDRHIAWDGFDPGTIGSFNSVLAPSGARTVYLPRTHSPELQNERDVYVHLPDGYDASTARYPALYVQDGNESIVRGQFHVIANETAAANAATAAIVVFAALPSQGVRIDEYTMGTAGSRGDDYVDFLANTLVPFVDGAFRTRAERDARGVNGASLGGLVSFWAAMQHPDVFGYTAGMSSSFFWGDDYLIGELMGRGCQDVTYYLDSGSPDDNFDVTQATRDVLAGLGCDYDYVLEENGQHDWAFWRGRFAGVLTDFADLHGGQR